MSAGERRVRVSEAFLQGPRRRPSDAEDPGSACQFCQGRGRTECRECGGQGRTNAADAGVLPKGVWPVWCPACLGAGRAPCEPCLGTGRARRVGFRLPTVPLDDPAP